MPTVRLPAVVAGCLATALAVASHAGAQEGGGASAPAPPAPLAPSAAPSGPGLDSITAEDLKQHISTLAADDMKGRDVKSGGIEKAATYVRDQMKSIGLKPAGLEGTYFHTFRVGRIAMNLEATTISAGGDRLALADGWLPFEPCNGIWKAPLVFGGTGSAEDWGKLKPDAVKGAIVVISAPRQLFARETFSALPKFAEQAKQAGALGLIHVSQRDLPASMWNRLLTQVARPRPGDDGDIVKPGGACPIWMERRAFDRLLGDHVQAFLTGTPFETRFEGPVTIEAVCKVENVTTYKNICGTLEGTDPELKKQYVAFTAHYDHIGTRRVAEGQDGIFNGADDDASGIAAILEIAQGFTRARPKRSILLIAFTAEEQGLKGSKRWVTEPTVPLKQIVCDFNVEMVGRPAQWGPGSLWVTGYARSTLGAIAAEAGKAVGMTAKPDPYRGMGFFRRSDNYSLAKHGIPAHSFSSFDPNTHHDYHQPGDEVSKIDFPNMQTLVRGIFVAAQQVASGEATPTWVEGDPLGRVERK